MKTIDNEFKKKLWASADALRGNISSEQYMLIIIGILFLKYSSDKYQKAVKKIKEDYPNNWKEFIFDKDILAGHYHCSFIVPEKAQWEYLANFASSFKIGAKIDQAFLSLEEKNNELEGLFDKNYNRQELDQNKLGKVVAEFSNIDLNKYGEDIIGRTYEYFLGHFFKKQGQKGGEFYTPSSIVKLLVEIIQPRQGKIYDPACGTGGMFIQARQYALKQNFKSENLIIYGQEYQNKIWKLAQINLLLHNFNSLNLHLGTKSADTFTNDQHKGELFDYILANPPFNIKKWGWENLQNDERWKWGLPPKNNANYGWLSHIVSKLNKKGLAGIILADISLTSNKKADLIIRKNFLLSNKIDAVITLPNKLFFTTTISACLWIFNNQKFSDKILMINANGLSGNLLDRKLRELTNLEIKKISQLYKKYKKGKMINEKDFAKSVSLQEIIEKEYSLLPNIYVDSSEKNHNSETIKIEINKLNKEIKMLFQEFKDLSKKVEKSIEKSLKLKNNKKK